MLFEKQWVIQDTESGGGRARGRQEVTFWKETLREHTMGGSVLIDTLNLVLFGSLASRRFDALLPWKPRSLVEIEEYDLCQTRQGRK